MQPGAVWKRCRVIRSKFGVRMSVARMPHWKPMTRLSFGCSPATPVSTRHIWSDTVGVPVDLHADRPPDLQADRPEEFREGEAHAGIRSPAGGSIHTGSGQSHRLGRDQTWRKARYGPGLHHGGREVTRLPFSRGSGVGRSSVPRSRVRRRFGEWAGDLLSKQAGVRLSPGLSGVVYVGNRCRAGEELYRDASVVFQIANEAVGACHLGILLGQEAARRTAAAPLPGGTTARTSRRTSTTGR
jgi:hypothetical protein